MSAGKCWMSAAALGVALLATPARAQQPAAGQPVTAPAARPGGEARTRQESAYLAPPPIRAGQPISVLAFPFANGEEVVAADGAIRAVSPTQYIAGYVTAAVKAGYLSSPTFSLATYHPQSALILRGRQGEFLKPEHLVDLVGPDGTVNMEKARVVAQRLAMQTILSGSVDLRTDANANSAEVTVQAQLVNSVTGAVMRTAAVSGAAAGAAGVPVNVVQERAAAEAAQKLLPALGIELVLPTAPPPDPRAGGATSVRRAAPSRASSEPAQNAREAAREAKRQADMAEREARKKADLEKAAARKSGEQAKREARDQAEAARKAADTARRAQEALDKEAARLKKEAEKAKKEGPSSSSKAGDEKTAAAVGAESANQDALPAQAPRLASNAAAAQARTSGSSMAAPGTARGTANSAGQAVPYGYAIDTTRSAVPERSRRGIKIPVWMGVAGFLTGISFLL